MAKGNCSCRELDCWDEGDYSWLASNSGWHGVINGCPSSVFFIHGKNIREQRQLPEGNWPVADMRALVATWAVGLPNGRLVVCHDTGGGDSGFWIEGEREPNDEDWARLEECRAHQQKVDRREFERLRKKFADA